jgi:hypothetical protein
LRIKEQETCLTLQEHDDDDELIKYTEDGIPTDLIIRSSKKSRISAVRMI